MPDHLIIIDCSGFAYRAYYARAPQYHAQFGQPTGAVEIFLSMIWHLLGRAEVDLPTMAAAVFDPPGITWRQKLFPAYKANRDPGRAAELKEQFPIMRECAPVLGLTAIERATFEADDVIATLAFQARKRGIRATIVSSDKDFAQLVDDGKIEIVDPMKRVRILKADVRKKWGVDPKDMPVLQALAGDMVDGIPGLSGVGKELAAGLIRRLGGDLEVILRSHGERHRPTVKHQLRTRGDDARLYLKLTTLRTNVPGKIDFEKFRRRPIMKADVLTLLDKLGARGRAQALLGLDLEIERAVEQDPTALDWWKEELRQKGQRITDEPQCGYFKITTFLNGPVVPARIWREPAYHPQTGEKMAQEILLCHVNGKPRDPRQMWPRLSMGCIKKTDYDTMMANVPRAPAPPEDPAPVKTDWSKVETPSFKKKRKA